MSLRRVSLRSTMRHTAATAATLLLAISFVAAWTAAANTAKQSVTRQQPAAKRQRERKLKVSPASAPASSSPAPRDGANAPDEDDDVVRVDTSLTNVLLTAVDKDRRFVTTLKREDVRLLENGQPQEISLFERETNLPLSLALLLDASKSQERTLPDEQSAARDFVERVLRPAKDSMTVISFNAEPTSEQSLTDDKAKLRAAIDRVKIELPPDNPECRNTGDVPVDEDPRCWTGIWDSLWITVNEVLSQTPERTRRAVILLSDGEDTSSATKRQEAIDFAVRHNVVVYSIGIGEREYYGMNEGALRKVAEQTGGRAFFPVSKPELDAAFAQIEQELRAQYLISYTPSNKQRDGSFRQLKIEIVNPELRKQKMRLLYRQGYYAKSRG
ncbi:MAG TPA: VWA domain-containing protein [Pyrinomonadaceae bacterium]|nr:VWA domain-containing protein [Pyrinomonadaceae bacterium]